MAGAAPGTPPRRRAMAPGKGGRRETGRVGLGPARGGAPAPGAPPGVRGGAVPIPRAGVAGTVDQATEKEMVGPPPEARTAAAGPVPGTERTAAVASEVRGGGEMSLADPFREAADRITGATQTVPDGPEAGPVRELLRVRPRLVGAAPIPAAIAPRAGVVGAAAGPLEAAPRARARAHLAGKGAAHRALARQRSQRPRILDVSSVLSRELVRQKPR